MGLPTTLALTGARNGRDQMIRRHRQMRTIIATEASRRFSDLLDAIEAGESVVVTRGNRPIAEIRPVARRRGATFWAASLRRSRPRSVRRRAAPPQRRSRGHARAASIGQSTAISGPCRLAVSVCFVGRPGVAVHSLRHSSGIGVSWLWPWVPAYSHPQGSLMFVAPALPTRACTSRPEKLP